MTKKDALLLDSFLYEYGRRGAAFDRLTLFSAIIASERQHDDNETFPVFSVSEARVTLSGVLRLASRLDNRRAGMRGRERGVFVYCFVFIS